MTIRPPTNPLNRGTIKLGIRLLSVGPATPIVDSMNSTTATVMDAYYNSLLAVVQGASMVEDSEQHMLLELDKKLEQGPLHIRPDEVADIGKDAGLNEAQAYRTFNRLHRDDRIIGAPSPVEEHQAGWGLFWLEDVRL